MFRKTRSWYGPIPALLGVSWSETTTKVSHRQPFQVGDYKADNIPAGQNRMPIEVQVRIIPHPEV